MTLLPKRILLLGTVACALGAAQPAAAQVQPAGTGEPAYTNSQQNTQWFEWPAASGADGYRVRYDYYENSTLVANPTVNNAPNGAQNVWANWSGVKTLQHGGQYGICAQGAYSFPNDSLYFPDGPNSCSTGTQLGRRAHTTIDRSKPATTIALAGGAATTNDAKVAIDGRLRRRRRRPVPGQLPVLPVRRQRDTSATTGAGFIYGYNSACSVPRQRRQVDDVHLHGGLRRGRRSRSRRPGVGVRDRRRRLDPRQPERSQPGPVGRESEPLRRQLRQRAARPHGAAGRDRRARVAEVGELVSFGAQASDATSGLGAGYEWSFGDNTAPPARASPSTTRSPSAGTYEVRVRTADAAGKHRHGDEGDHDLRRPATAANGNGTAAAVGTGGGSTDGGTDDDSSTDDDAPDEAAFEVSAPRKLKLARAKALPIALSTETRGKVSLALVRSGRVIARGSKVIGAGTTSYRLKLPRKAKAGRHVLKVTFTPQRRRGSHDDASRSPSPARRPRPASRAPPPPATGRASPAPAPRSRCPTGSSAVQRKRSSRRAWTSSLARLRAPSTATDPGRGRAARDRSRRRAAPASPRRPAGGRAAR